MEYQNNTTGVRFALIRLDGTTLIASSSSVALTDIYATALNVSTQYYLNMNQYVELVAIQTSGGALNVLANGNRSPEFGMVYVGE